MPKLKSNRSAAKRFRKTASGKLRRGRSFSSHLFTGKSPKRKRKLRRAALISKADLQRMRRLVPY